MSKLIADEVLKYTVTKRPSLKKQYLFYKTETHITKQEYQLVILKTGSRWTERLLPVQWPRCLMSICSCFIQDASRTKQGLLQELPSEAHTGLKLYPLQSILHTHLLRKTAVTYIGRQEDLQCHVSKQPPLRLLQHRQSGAIYHK